jgi:hypothetical protein
MRLVKNSQADCVSKVYGKNNVKFIAADELFVFLLLLFYLQQQPNNHSVSFPPFCPLAFSVKLVPILNGQFFGKGHTALCNATNLWFVIEKP